MVGSIHCLNLSQQGFAGPLQDGNFATNRSVLFGKWCIAARLTSCILSKKSAAVRLEQNKFRSFRSVSERKSASYRWSSKTQNKSPLLVMMNNTQTMQKFKISSLFFNKWLDKNVVSKEKSSPTLVAFCCDGGKKTTSLLLIASFLIIICSFSPAKHRPHCSTCKDLRPVAC